MCKMKTKNKNHEHSQSGRKFIQQSAIVGRYRFVIDASTF